MDRKALSSVHSIAAVLFVAAMLLGLGPWVPLNRVEASTASTMRSVPAGWHTQASGTQQQLFAVACFDALRCKAVGAGGTIQYTKNAGVTWRPQNNPLAGSSTDLSRIVCVGRSTCYVIGRPNIVMVTHNGGVRWSVHRFALPGSTGELTDTACVNAQTFDIRGRLALCRLGLLDLACIDPSTCVVVATLHVQGQLFDLGSAMYLTTDGGSTWTSQAIPAAAPCRGDCGPPNTTVPYPLEWVWCGPGTLCRAGGSIFIGSHEGYATLIIQASKPGATWTPVGNGAQTSPESVVCPTATRCYGVWTTSPFDPPNEIWRSTDGGGSWSAESSGSARLRNAIACPGAQTCYSVGNQGTITASYTGSPFARQHSPTSHDLYGITCISLRACFAVGNKGTIVART
jgi:photosystem II stability/assembly factor-like uncharacterized protein